MNARLRIGIVTDDSPDSAGQPARLRAALWGLGHSWVRVGGRELATEAGQRTLLGCDLVVAHSTDLVTLCLLSGIEGLSVPTVNSSTAIARVQDKIKMLGLLRAARIPSVHSYIGGARAIAEGAKDDEYPLEVRSATETRNPATLVASPSELRAFKSDDTLIAHSRATGLERHLYVIGESVWAVQRPVTKDRMNVSVAPLSLVPLRAVDRELALRCGAMFALELFAVQVIVTDAGPQVLDVSAFPSYDGLPGVSGKLATYVERRAREQRDLSRQGT